MKSCDWYAKESERYVNEGFPKTANTLALLAIAAAAAVKESRVAYPELANLDTERDDFDIRKE